MTRWFALLAVLLGASAAFAADGGSYTAGNGLSHGDNSNAAKILLCDSKTTTGACASGAGISVPDGYKDGPIWFEIDKDTGCSACTVEIRMGTGVDEQHLITTLTCGSNTAYSFPRGYGVLGKIYPSVTALSGCSDLDVAAFVGLW